MTGQQSGKEGSDSNIAGIAGNNPQGKSLPQNRKARKNLSRTEQTWQTLDDGSRVFDHPKETGDILDSQQGKVDGFKGTCGLVSCVNVLRMAGIDITEQDIVSYASTTKSDITGKLLCESGLNPMDNGGTSADDRREILEHFGVYSVCLPADTDSIARYVEEGRGVIISVLCIKFYPSGRRKGLHAVTVTSEKRDINGEIVGFYVCDSYCNSARYCDKYQLAESLSGRTMNVTSDIIR